MAGADKQRGERLTYLRTTTTAYSGPLRATHTPAAEVDASPIELLGSWGAVCSLVPKPPIW